MYFSIANIISFVLNPILVLLFVPFMLVYRSTNDGIAAVLWTFYSAAFLLAMTVYLIINVKKGNFTDLDVSKREQRPRLFITSFIMAVVYLAGVFLLHGPNILYIVIIGIIIGLVLLSIINTRIKASMHVATIAAFFLAVAIDYQGWYYLLLLLIPLVAWSRVVIKKHTLPETIAGGVFGSILSLLLFGVIELLFSK